MEFVFLLPSIKFFPSLYHTSVFRKKKFSKKIKNKKWNKISDTKSPSLSIVERITDTRNTDQETLVVIYLKTIERTKQQNLYSPFFYQYRCLGLFNPWLTGCVSMWPQILLLARAVDLVMQIVLLGCTVTAAGFSWRWSAIGADYLLCYLLGRYCKETRGGLKRPSEVTS